MGHKLIQLGITLFLLGLLTGFAAVMLANPRMGLSSHLEGVMNGMFLVLLGLIWERLKLSNGALRFTFWLAVYGTFVNWFTILLAAIWGAGGSSMPIVAQSFLGSSMQETIIKIGLFSLSFAMIIVCVLVLWGLRSYVAKAEA